MSRPGMPQRCAAAAARLLTRTRRAPQGPLLALAPRLAGYCAPGGLLALSGILAAQAPAVQAAYAPFFLKFKTTTSDGGDWALLTAVRRGGVGGEAAGP